MSEEGDQAILDCHTTSVISQQFWIMIYFTIHNLRGGEVGGRAGGRDGGLVGGGVLPRSKANDKNVISPQLCSQRDSHSCRDCE